VVGRSGVARHGHARLKQLAVVRLVFHRDPYRYRLQALEASGRLKVRALLAAMERRPAFGTLALPIDIGSELGGTIKTASRHYVLEQPGQARASDVNRRPGTGRLGPVGKRAVSGPTVGVHVAPLSVLTVVVHV